MRKFKTRMSTKAKKALAVAVVLTTAGALVSWPSPKAGAMQVAAPGAGQALALATVNAAAQFGDSVWRTHENGIRESYFWGLTTFLSTVTNPKNGQTYHLGYGNSTPVEYNDTLYFAVPANNEGASDDPNAPGYLIALDMSPSGWQYNKQTGTYEPTIKWVQPVTGVSNSAPVIDKATGNVYLAAGDNLYGFQPDGSPITPNSQPGGGSLTGVGGSSSTDQHNMYSSDPIYQNQVVGYPLYASAQNTGMSEDTIWVGSQNGYLYAFDASNLSQLYKIYIGSRIDGTPVLAYSVSGIPYIIIGTAYAPGNKGGTGTLYVIDPTTGKIVSKLQTPSGAPVNGSVIQTAQGYIAWNDYDTDIYYGQLNDNGTISLLKSYWHVGGAGAYSALEAGYAGPSGTYILPVENKAEAAWVDFNNGTSGDIGLLGNAVGAPEISTNHIYVPDATGWVDVFDNSPSGLAGQTNQVANDFDLFNALQHGGQKLVNGAGAAVLTSDFEGMASNPYIGQSVPTFFQPTSGGLAIWQNDGGIYKTSPDYTSADPKDFSQPITLTYVGGDLPTILTNAPNNFDDTLTVQASANGGKNWTTLGTVETFSSGVLNKTITLSTDMLNKAIGITGWNANGPNTVIIKITATPGDLFGYEFESQDEKDIPSSYGQVTVKFPSSVATGYGSWICTNKHGCWDWEGGAIHLWVLQTMEAKTPLWGGKLGDALHGGAFTVYPMNKPSKYNTSRYVTVWAQIAPNSSYIGREFDAHLEAYVEIVKNVPYAYTYISGWTNATTTCVAQNAAGQCTATQSTPPQPIYSTIILHMNVPTVYREVSPDVRLYWDGGKTNDDTQHLRFAWNIPVPDQGGPWVPCDQAYAGRWRMNPYSLTEWTTGYIDGNTWEQAPVCHADDPLESDWPKGKYPLGVPYPGAQMQWAPYDDMHNNGYQYEPIAGTEYAAWPPNWRVGADEYMPMIIVRAIGDWGDWTDPEITVWTPTVPNGWDQMYVVPGPSKTTVTPNNSKG